MARFSFALMLLAVAYCAAQDATRVSGVVRDSSGAAVAGAEVTLRSAHSNLSVRSGSDGSFVFPSVADTAGTVRVSAAEFAPEEQSYSGSATELQFVLRPAGANESVVVSASRTEMKLSDVPGSAVLVSREDIQANPALTLDDMLRQVPGFQLFRRSSSRVSNPTTQGVSLRGLGASGPSRALVLEDGVPIVDPFGGWVYWDRIPRAELGSVEVFRGGASSLYGSDALGGVVQFVTRTSSATSASVDLSYGNEDTPDLSAWVGSVVSRWDVGAGVDMSRTDGYILVPAFQRGAVDALANSRHATVDASAGYRIGETGRAFLRGTFFDEGRNNGTRVTANSTGMGFGVAGINTSVGTHDWISARVYGQAQGYDQTFSSVASDRNSETLTDIQHVPSQQLGAAAQWNHVIGRQTLIAGLDGQEILGASDERLFSGTTGAFTATNIAGGRQRAIGIFGQDIVQISNWTLIGGARWDDWKNFRGQNLRIPVSGAASDTLFADRTQNAFSPRISVLRKLNSNLSLALAGYRAFRAPTLNELYRSFRQGNTLTQSNAFLGPERSTGAEVGLRETALSGRLETRQTVFWTDVVNPVTNVTLSQTPTLITRQRQNIGRTRSIGTELDGSFRVNAAIQLSAGYQYTHAVVVDSTSALVGLSVPEVPRHQLSWEARYWKPSVAMLSVQGRYSSLQFDDDLNTLRLGGVYVMDLSLGRQFRHGLTGYISAENLLNRRYPVALSAPLSNPLQNLGPPILARIGLRLDLPPAK